GNEICLLNHCVFVAAADRGKDLLAQPGQIDLELRQHRNRPEIPSERLVAVQQDSRVLLNQNINGVQEALQIALLAERCAKIRHDEISDKHDTQVRQFDKH